MEATDNATVEAAREAESNHAAVVLDGKSLFQVSGTSGYPADKRASEISDRLYSLAAQPTRSTGTLKIIAYPEYAAIMAEETLLIRVFDSDSGMPGLNHAVYAEVVKNSISKAIVEYRHAREPKVLLKSAGLAAAGVGLLLLLLVSWTRVYRKTSQWLEHH